MNSLATRDSAPGHLAGPMAPMALPDLFKLAEMLVTTGFLAKAVDTPAKAVAIMLKGQELGIPPMYALNNIAVINGKTVCQAELMLSLIYRDHGSRALEVVKTNDRVCRVRYQRRGGQPGELAFTVEEAEAAGLLNKPGPPGGVAPWKGYRPAMLRARVISAAARIAFPDTIAGMYTPEEMGARVVVTSDGAVVLDEDQPPMLEPVSSAARSYDGESIRPAPTGPVKHSPQVQASGSSPTKEAQKEEPDPLAEARAERERLLQRFGKLLDSCAAVGFEVEELNLDELSNAELLGAGTELRRRYEAYKDQRGEAML